MKDIESKFQHTIKSLNSLIKEKADTDQKRFLFETLDALQTAVLILDKNGNIVYSNRLGKVYRLEKLGDILGKLKLDNIQQIKKDITDIICHIEDVDSKKQIHYKLSIHPINYNDNKYWIFNFKTIEYYNIVKDMFGVLNSHLDNTHNIYIYDYNYTLLDEKINFEISDFIPRDAAFSFTNDTFKPECYPEYSFAFNTLSNKEKENTYYILQVKKKAAP